jgi:hypothetical protein
LNSSTIVDQDHFELGEIGKSEAELKAVVGFRITNEVRNHIEGMPQNLALVCRLREQNCFCSVSG